MGPTELLRFIAEKLGDLRDQVVFVGGATSELLITDPAAPPRPRGDDRVPLPDPPTDRDRSAGQPARHITAPDSVLPARAPGQTVTSLRPFRRGLAGPAAPEAWAGTDRHRRPRTVRETCLIRPAP